MQTQTTIWTLNKAYDLIAGPQQLPVEKTAEEVQDELCREFSGRIVFGQRPIYGNQLMPDDEYFVPIAPKCFGSSFTSDDPVISAIRQYYGDAGQATYTTFWDKETDGYQMKTPNYTGYYALIEQSAPVILIGYSQGGLVARYLYWLDRAVFKKNLIRNVITISSPDFGSPLANPDNTASIVSGLIEIVCCIFGKKTRWLDAPIIKELDHIIIREFIDNVRKRIDDTTHRKNLSAEDTVKQQALSGFLQNLFNWLGGLRNDPNNAFYDLNLMRMEPNYSAAAARYSVLASINQTVGSTGDIHTLISANMLSKDLLYDAAFMVIIEELQKCLHHNKALAAAFKAMGVSIDKAAYRSSPEMFDQIDTIYSQTVMTEHPSKTITNPLITATIERHTDGTTDLKPYAHDFIIPSAYQVNDSAEAGGTGQAHINDDANHLSGSELCYTAGNDNRSVAIDILHKILD